MFLEFKNSKDNLEKESWLRSAKAMRWKLILDCGFSQDFDFLKSVYHWEESGNLFQIVSKFLQEGESPKPSWESANESLNELAEVKEALYGEDQTQRRRALIFILKNRRTDLLPALMKLHESDNSDPYLESTIVQLQCYHPVLYQKELQQFMKSCDDRSFPALLKALNLAAVLPAHSVLRALLQRSLEGSATVRQQLYQALKDLHEELAPYCWEALMFEEDQRVRNQSLSYYVRLFPEKAAQALSQGLFHGQNVSSDQTWVISADHQESAKDSFGKIEAEQSPVNYAQTESGPAQQMTDKGQTRATHALGNQSSFQEAVEPRVESSQIQGSPVTNPADAVNPYLELTAEQICDQLPRITQFQDYDRHLNLLKAALPQKLAKADERLGVLKAIGILATDELLETAEMILYSMVDAPEDDLQQAQEYLLSYSMNSRRMMVLLNEFRKNLKEFQNFELTAEEQSTLEQWNLPSRLRKSMFSQEESQCRVYLEEIRKGSLLESDEETVYRYLHQAWKERKHSNLHPEIFETMSYLLEKAKLRQNS